MAFWFGVLSVIVGFMASTQFRYAGKTPELRQQIEADVHRAWFSICSRKMVMMMICETCQGTKLNLEDTLFQVPVAPCPACNGFGIVNCCDGLQEQPEPPKEEDEPPNQI
jgi:hypothetical protein